MNLRGAVNNKSWKQRRRDRARSDVVDMRDRRVIVQGVEFDKEFSFDLNGHHIGKCHATRVYFHNGQRVAELRAEDKTDINVRLMRAFYSIEART